MTLQPTACQCVPLQISSDNYTKNWATFANSSQEIFLLKLSICSVTLGAILKNYNVYFLHKFWKNGLICILASGHSHTKASSLARTCRYIFCCDEIPSTLVVVQQLDVCPRAGDLSTRILRLKQKQKFFHTFLPF